MRKWTTTSFEPCLELLVHILWTLLMHMCQEWEVVCNHRGWHNCFSSCKCKKGWEEVCAIYCNLAFVEARLLHDWFWSFQGAFQVFKDDNYTCKHCTYSIGWTMVELMHNTILQAIRVAIQKSTFIPISCDHYLS